MADGLRKMAGEWFRQDYDNMEEGVNVKEQQCVTEFVKFLDEDTIIFLKNEIIVGRQINSNVILDNGLISRKHCMIKRHFSLTGNFFTVTDLGSKHGTSVKKRGRKTPVKLEPYKEFRIEKSDVIRLGQDILLFV